ncbi:MAG: hypothetical protein GQ564_10105 [Bacteroidales bacterium]|nr:hypothetical protein [Bacteroidales bacterium]
MKKILLSITLISFLSVFSESIYAQQEQANQTLSQVESLQIQHKDKIDAAFAAMEAVKKAGAYIESISDLIGNGEITLPVGIKKGEYELIIQKITYDPQKDKPSIFATCAFQFKDDGQKIAFEGSADIEGKKGLGTNGFLELIAPVRRNLGKEAALVFNSGTRVNFGCDGIESYLAKIDLIVTSENIFAVNKDGAPSSKPLASKFDATFRDFDDFTVSFSFDQSFSLKSLKDIIFTLRGATLDQSDIETSAMVQFPQDYFSGSNQDEKKLWRGISISEASIALPEIFKKSSATNDTTNENDSSLLGSSDRIEIALTQVLLDNNGFSGTVTAENIMSSDALDQSKWDISVNDFLLSILKNDLSGFGFGGDLNIPPLGNSSLLPYMATFNPGTQEYSFAVNVSGDYDFPVLMSTLSLNETSTIEVMFKDADVYPTLNATGKISINASLSKSDSTKKFSLPDVTFENLKISREEPYVEIGAIGVSGDLTSPKIAGFELSISDIRSFSNNSGSGLAFDAGVKLNDMFGGEAGLQLYGDYAAWKFDRVGVDKIMVDFKSKAFSIKGGVMFKNGDEIYGSGFRGEVAFSLIDKLNLDAVAVFGKKDDYRYFLTDVFLELSPSSGIIIPPALSFYGFGGGFYKRMQQSYDTNIDSEFGKSLSGINYVPDKEVGMGLMAATKFGLVGSSSTFNAKVSFEMQFNQYGGLNFIQFRGDAAFMDSPEKWGKLADNINDKVKKLEEAGGKLKLSAKSDLKVPENKSGGFLTASMNIKFDIANSIFSADLSAYLNAGFVKGVGPNDRMGWASAYFSQDKWYTYIGTPSDRIGVEVLGLARLDGYFMVGDDIPELPLPPQKVLQNFSQEKQDQLSQRTEGAQATGSGLAFGLSLGVEFEATLPPFYAKIGAGLGSEFLLKNYGSSAYCLGGNSTLGINGWYARAQAWAWVEADIGMEAKIFSKTRKFSILDMSASALLAGAGPNPFYFTGAVGGRFSVLGGLVSGQCDFDFEIGEECIIRGGNPFGADVIAQLTPDSGEDDVNVFASPQAVFNIPVGLEMEIDEEGHKVFYKISLEEFKVYYKETNQALEGYKQLGDDGKLYMLDPSEPFESQKDMVVFAKVGFKRKLNGSWIDVKGNDGSPFYEIKEAEFKSGDRPKEILPEHVKFSYPVAMQYNYYPNEHESGYIFVTENYSYLFSTEKPEGFNQVMMFTDTDEKKSQTNFSYKANSADNDIRLEIDYSTQNINFSNDEIYKMTIVNVPQNTSSGISGNITTSESKLNDNEDISVTTQQAEGTLDMLEQKEIYALHFRTSSYNTFVEKMNAIPNYEGVAWQEYPHVHLLGSNLYDGASTSEMFDVNESNSLFPDNNLIRIKPIYSKTDWYNNKISDLIYENKEMLAAAGMSGLKPPDHVEVIQIKSMTRDNQLSEDIIESNSRPFVSSFGAFHNRSAYYIDRDFIALRNALANKLVNVNNSSNNVAKFLKEDNIPGIRNGKYEMQVNYTLPGKNIITSSVTRSIELTKFID